uniref:Uncharacterized protein n=1 Tax=Panagrolaimus superbus TaxID=310955 RepID=A0A914Z5G9_9BILA
MTSFFGSTADVLSSGILDVSMLFGTQMLSSAVEIGKVIPAAIKGIIPGLDPLSQSVKELSKTFKEKIEEAKLSDLEVELILNDFLKDIKVGSEILMLNTYNILKYNVSQRDIDDFKSFCRYNSKGSPDVLSVVSFYNQ